MSGKKESQKKKKNDDRFCARCRNHEEHPEPLKGHKKYCPWQNCFCADCRKTVHKQRVMAEQTKRRRDQKDLENRAKLGLPCRVPPAEPKPPEAASKKTQSQRKENCSVSWESITELMWMCNLTVSNSELILLVLKYICPDVKDASKIIMNGSQVLLCAIT